MPAAVPPPAGWQREEARYVGGLPLCSVRLGNRSARTGKLPWQAQTAPAATHRCCCLRPCCPVGLRVGQPAALRLLVYLGVRPSRLLAAAGAHDNGSGGLCCRGPLGGWVARRLLQMHCRIQARGEDCGVFSNLPRVPPQQALHTTRPSAPLGHHMQLCRPPSRVLEGRSGCMTDMPRSGQP
jgi:hypothetical protein